MLKMKKAVKPLEVERLEALFNDLSSVSEDMDNKIKELNDEVRIYDLEIQDILHKIEGYNFNASEGFLLARELKIASGKRREAKNNISIICSAKAKFEESFRDVNLDKMSLSISQSVKDQINSMNRRKYKARVREDLFD